MLLDAILFIFSFIVLWFGAGIAVSSVEKVARGLKIAPFIVSFFILGLLTSAGEISVGIFSVLDKTPEISVGNIIGASVVLTLLAIPLLSVLNGGVNFGVSEHPVNFSISYLIISLPVFLILDGVISMLDAYIMLGAFIFLIASVSRRSRLLQRVEDILIHPRVNMLGEMSKVIAGMVCVIFAGKFIVDSTVLYSEQFSLSPFVIGLLLLALGTNLPELSVLARSVVAHRNDVAMGDYVGSAAINTLILSGVVFLNGAPIVISTGLKPNIALLPIGGLLFLVFTKDNRLGKKEGFLLLGLYALFIFVELFV